MLSGVNILLLDFFLFSLGKASNANIAIIVNSVCSWKKPSIFWGRTTNIDVKVTSVTTSPQWKRQHFSKKKKRQYSLLSPTKTHKYLDFVFSWPVSTVVRESGTNWFGSLDPLRNIVVGLVKLFQCSTFFQSLMLNDVKPVQYVTYEKQSNEQTDDESYYEHDTY